MADKKIIKKETKLTLEGARSDEPESNKISIEDWMKEHLIGKTFQHTLTAAIQLNRESLHDLYWYLKATIFYEDGEPRGNKAVNSNNNYLHALLLLAHIEEYGIEGKLYPQRNDGWGFRNFNRDSKKEPLLQSVQDAVGDVWDDYEVKSYGYTTQAIFDITHDNPELLKELMMSEELNPNGDNLFYIPVGHFGTHNVVPPDDVRLDKKFNDYAEFLQTTLQDSHGELEDWKKYYENKIDAIEKENINKSKVDYPDHKKMAKLDNEKEIYRNKLKIISNALKITRPLMARKIDTKSDWYTPDINFIIDHHIALNQVANHLTNQTNLNTLLQNVRGFEVEKIVFFVALFSVVGTLPAAVIGAVLSAHSLFTKGTLDFFKPASQKLEVKGKELRKKIKMIPKETVDKFKEKDQPSSKKSKSKEDIISNMPDDEIDINKFRDGMHSIIDSPEVDVDYNIEDYDRFNPRK